MFKIINISLGIILFLIGISLPLGVNFTFWTLIPFMFVLMGTYFLSRPMALDYAGFGYFLIGMFLLIPSFFVMVPFLLAFDVDASLAQVCRIFSCLVSGVMGWLSIRK